MLITPGSDRYGEKNMVSEPKKAASQRGGFRDRNSGLGGSAHRAGFSAGTAFNAGIRIDYVLSGSFADCGNGALGSTGAAADAFVRNFVSHDSYLQFYLRGICPSKDCQIPLHMYQRVI